MPELLAALDDDGAAVLIAPPGAGKTTGVALALLGQDWCRGQVILLSPRRVAARAAAERMAAMLDENTGETVGYLTRLDSRLSAKTRILVMTEAIFVNRIVDDAELSGTSAVLFDEAHERHLDSDLGLALALESRSVLRDDLRICIMSATLDGARFAKLLGDDARVIESEGRAYPLEVKWLGAQAGQAAGQATEDAMAAAIMTAWRDEEGDILAFLPGVREISRTLERVSARLPNTPILPLHGQVDPASQRAAIQRDSEGRRRIVLATAIAETSLTLDGVSVVVDSGLARHAEFDRAAGTTHLVTRRASQASATQRAGRAARQGPGTAYRLWEEAGHAGRPKFDPPEIETADLAPLALTLAGWGAHDPAALAWLDPPPQASLASAQERLSALGALDGQGRMTELGRKITALPLDPISAAAVLYGAQAGQALQAARLVALTQERGLGGRGEDLLARLDRWKTERGKRASEAQSLAKRWADKADRLVASPPHNGAQNNTQSGINPAVFLAQARPDNIAKRRDRDGGNWLSTGGRGFVLDPASPLARAEWLIIADAQGQAKGARITAAAELSLAEIEAHFGEAMAAQSRLNWNADAGRVEARLERRFGAIKLSSGPDPAPDEGEVTALLVEKALARLATLLPEELLARAGFAGVEVLNAETLTQRAEEWLAPLLTGRRNLDLGSGRYADAALTTLDWDARQKLDREAPREFISPAGSHHKIAYTGDDAPSVEVRVQALFGLEMHPMIGAKPLLLKLTSPAGRPIQSTRDLPGFWRGSWEDVRKDMKGRYPKHRWPQEPWAEKPSLKTKNAFSKRGG